jgi:hypothetical protein
MEMTRDEQLAFAKERALAVLANGNVQGAYQSMVSDLTDHSETAGHPGLMLGMMELMTGHLSTVQAMRHHIEGYN